MDEALKQRKANAKKLAEGYSVGKQRLETFCVASFLMMFSYGIYNLASFASEALGRGSAPGWSKGDLVLGGTACGVASFLAIVAADLISGLVHWGFDTWGSIDVPIVGQTFIRSFREHHVNPAALANHDWRETNGDNCLTTLLPLLYLCCCEVTSGWSSIFGLQINYVSLTFWLMLIFFVMLTNQIHKWAHMQRKLVPSWVIYCQEKGIILGPKHHNVHHKGIHDTYYCITTGWLNAPLHKMDFWRRTEAFITSVTGAKPRNDDMGWLHDEK